MRIWSHQSITVSVLKSHIWIGLQYQVPECLKGNCEVAWDKLVTSINYIILSWAQYGTKIWKCLEVKWANSVWKVILQMKSLWSNLPEKYDEILIIWRIVQYQQALMCKLFVVICKKLNPWYRKLNEKLRKENKRKGIGS